MRHKTQNEFSNSTTAGAAHAQLNRSMYTSNYELCPFSTQAQVM